MTQQLKKLLANQSLGFSRQVTAERLRQAGVVIGNDMKLKLRPSSTEFRVPRSLLKKLAGG